jgi:alkanesulfonate monooxygenase SsuD/methylene tetrahydromethanopterin reductase-like flavin-dependent oxidoreductase (luciferase family)
VRAYPPVPPGLPVGTAIVAALLAVLGAACAMTARAHQPRLRTIVAVTTTVGLSTAAVLAAAQSYNSLLVAVLLLRPALVVHPGGGDGYSALPGTAILAILIAAAVTSRLRSRPPPQTGTGESRAPLPPAGPATSSSNQAVVR